MSGRAKRPDFRALDLLLSLLFALCVARLWLAPITSSFWVDELVTTFLARHPNHPSFAIAPSGRSIYYWLPRLSTDLFGSAEAAWRLPSLLAMALTLWLIARLARDLIHRGAGWFAVFACLALNGIDYAAIDARPYALGIAVSAASVLFLVRWFDGGRWLDALLFALSAALLWQVHLLYWPFYLVYAIYAPARCARRDTPVRAGQAATVAGLLIVSLAPVAWRALAILHDRQAHVFASAPTFAGFQHILHWNLPALCAAGAWLASRFLKSAPDRRPSAPSLILILAWWLTCPVALYVYSLASHNHVLVPRYVSLLLPGAALSATAVAAFFLPRDCWKTAALALAIAALSFQGRWSTLQPRHENSDWRGAAAEVNRLATPSTPVICPSPFVEARAPAWSPDYPLPGFLYVHLYYYPVRGDLQLFPYDAAPEAEPLAGSLLAGKLAPARHFVIYGQAGGAGFWYDWFAARPELAGWTRKLEKFGDVYVADFTAR